MIPGWEPARRVLETTGTHVIISIQPPKFLNLPEQKLRLTTEQYRRYCHWLAKGGLIQEVFPEIDPEHREIMQSGIGPEDWKRIMGESK